MSGAEYRRCCSRHKYSMALLSNASVTPAPPLLSDAEQHELGGPNRGDTDHADGTPIVDVILPRRTSFGSNTAHCVPLSMSGSM
jgi:hypothetical protein